MERKTMIKDLFFIKTGMFAIALIISQFAFAGQAGTVTFITGDVSIVRADKTVKQAAKNDALNAGDTIETRDGRLQLALIDGGKVSLQPNTVYRINKYEFSGKEDGTEYGFTELIKGGLRTISGLIGHKNRDRYQLKTAVATIGIRGTEFTVNFNNNQLLMTTNHGSVDVCNIGGCLNALSGQSIEVAGVGAKPKPSDIAATASVAPSAKKASVASNETEDSKSDTKSNSTKDSSSDSSIKLVTKSDSKSDSSITTETTTDLDVNTDKADIGKSNPIKLDIDKASIGVKDIGNSDLGKTDISNLSPIKLDLGNVDSINPSIDKSGLSNIDPNKTIDIINLDLSNINPGRKI